MFEGRRGDSLLNQALVIMLRDRQALILMTLFLFIKKSKSQIHKSWDKLSSGCLILLVVYMVEHAEWIKWGCLLVSREEGDRALLS